MHRTLHQRINVTPSRSVFELLFIYTGILGGGGHPSKIASAAPTEGPPIPV